MLIIHTEVPDDSSLPRQFIELVNRLLPAMWRFDVAPTPSLRVVASNMLFPNAAPQFSRASGSGSLRGPEIDTGLPPQWSARFRDALRAAVDPRGSAVTISLTRSDADVLVGQFADTAWRAISGVIDVADLSSLPREAAAAALAHELEEQRSRQTARLGFTGAHALASQAEGEIAGGMRLSAEERTTPGGRGPGRWEWWIPYALPGNGIRVLTVRGSGQNIERSRFIVFRDLPAYRNAAAASLAARPR